nr:T9SS type A sorting domain-containing protein [Candidatus Cloacimonadota bacterium]
TGTTSVTNAYIPYSVTITSTGTLLIYDNVEFGPYATLTIENGGLAIIWGNVLFGTNSKIIAEGELQINPQNLLNTILTSKINTWQGIECYEGGEIWVQNESIIENAETGIFSDGGEVHVIESTIYNCDYGIVLYNDSSLDFDSSTIIVPDNEIAVGISIVSSINECDIQITGGPALANSVIQGNGVGAGILIASMFNETEKKFNIINTTFDNLDEGFHIEGSEKTDDEISDCTFNNCNTGIYLNGIGSMKHIRDCGFTSNETGIQLNTFQVPIIHCGFISETSGCGIEFDYISGVPIDGPDPGPASVDSCSFYGDITGIRCVNATPRVAHCAFDGTGIGIDVFNKSLIDMAWNGNNSFYTTVHIMFRDSGLINILNGHNDFWDVLFDFIFAGNYDSSNNTLNCNGNYWSDRPLGEAIPYYEYINMMNEPEDFIIADFSRMDDYPNVPPGWDATNRYEEAGILEADGNPIEALALYTTILSEQLEEEKGFWMNCIDRTFNLSLQLNENLYNLVQFYDTFILNIPDFVPIEEREELICFVKNYQKKVYIEMESFQEAADIVIIRIEDPITTVDSLFAVMELESIYYLSSSGGGRSNVMTAYPQLAPEDCKQLQKWHDEHWDEIYALLGIGENPEDEVNQNIPLVPVLNGNYPNPFNPETKIAFSIPVDSKVNLTIYNIKGQKVKTLVNDQLEKGFHEIIWNSKDNNGKLVASGVYFYKFDVNGKTKGVKKMLLLK